MSIVKRFLEDAKPYFKHYPLMSNAANAELDGNSILYAGTYGILYAKLFDKYPDAGEHSSLLYKESYLPAQPGLITRGPHKWADPQTHDDYIGLCSLSYLGGGGAAKAIAGWGLAHRWSYVRSGTDSFKEWFNSQFWRMPGLVPHIKLCAGMDWSLFDKLSWSMGVFFNSLGKWDDTSGIILKWHMISVYAVSGQNNWLCDLAMRKWKRKLIVSHPNAMGDIFRIYYGPDHPFAKWANGLV